MPERTTGWIVRRASFAVILSAFACAPDRSENLGTTSENLWGNQVRIDDDTPNANVVVAIDKHTGTGIFITPKIVLTAAHVVNGAADKGCNPGVSNINIGQNTSAVDPVTGLAWTRSLALATEPPATLVSGCVDTGPVGNSEEGIDVALLYLNNQDIEPFVEKVAFHRPSFARPVPFQEGADVAGWSQLGPDISGFPGSQGGTINPQMNFRMLGLPNFFNGSPNPVDGAPDDHGHHWSWQWDGSVPNLRGTASGSVAVAPGDSGGPLFTERGWRDPIGVLHGVTYCKDTIAGVVVPTPFACILWADITAPSTTDWIRAHALDSAVHSSSSPTGGTGHSSTWLRNHRRDRADFWFGEVDWADGGSCDKSRDFDCDHWYDENDNCPYVPNTAQIDSNDDGFGDACSPCPCDIGNDRDGDGVCEHCDPVRGKVLGDNAAVSAMLDRLLHHAHVLKCGPRSYRTHRADLSVVVAES